VKSVRLLVAALAASALSIPAVCFAQSSLASDDSVDTRGLVVGLDGGYSLPRGHEYHSGLEPGFNILHGFAGFRLGNSFEIVASAMDVESGIKGSSAKALTRVYSIDGRFFAPVAGILQPNVLIGYAPIADLHYATAFGNATEHGYSINAGAGVRIAVVPHIFLTADFRHMFIRHTRGDLQNGGTTISGKFDHEQKGDIGAFLAGAGIQF
jgi:hypothetical protein